MDPHELEIFEQRLRAKARELRHLLRTRDQINIEPSADPVDELQSAAAREVAIVNLNRDSALLYEVNKALDRLKNGDFGICEDCEEPIDPRRLKAIAWATRCIRCQEARERSAENGAATGADPGEPLFPRAA